MSGSFPEPVLASSDTKPSRGGHSPSANLEWLDSHRWVSLALLALVPFLVTLPLWVCHLSLDPIWFYSGIVKNAKPGVNSVGIPFGDPNVGWISQALGHLAASQWMHGKVPWWNPYSAIGLPLAGGMQPGALFFPFVLLLLLSNGFVWLRVAIQLVAGFSTFALARELSLGRLASLVAGILFELSGTFAFTNGPDSAFCAAAFLPLLLLGIEQVSKRKRERSGTVWIALAIAFSLLAGFPEVAYVDGLFALLWVAFRFVVGGKCLRFALRVAWGGLLGVLLAAPLLAAFWPLLKQPSTTTNHLLGLGSLPVTSIPSMFVPYIYGPFPFATHHVEAFYVWSIGAYVGIVVFFCALLGAMAQKPRWVRLLLVAWVALVWARIYGVKPLTALMNHIPFLSETIFYRYSAPSWTLCLFVLAAFGIEELRHRTPRLRFAGLLTLAALAVSVHIAWPWRHYWHSSPAEIAVMSRYFAFGLAWALVSLLSAVLALLVLRGERRRVSIAAVTAINAAIFFCIPMLSTVRAGSIDWAPIHFLKDKLGLSRFYTLGPLQPNYGAYFRIASANYATYPVPDNLFEYLKMHLFPPLPKGGGALLWPGWFEPDQGLNYLCKFLPAYEGLGIRYVVADASTMEDLSPRAAVSTSNQNSEPLALKPGEQISFTVPAPQDPSGSGNIIEGISILLGNYGNTADGKLHVRLCINGRCAQGSRALSESVDNRDFYVSLSQPLPSVPGEPVAITASHVGGRNAVAFWMWPDLQGQNQYLVGTDGKIVAGRALRVSFIYRMGLETIPKVFHDSMIDIFELAHPASYYSIIRGGPCRLDASGRNFLRAVCVSPALLIRRELYMPGWHASINGMRQTAEPYDGIFQTFKLPRGDSHVRFAYIPLFEVPAMVACLFAAVALVVEVVFMLRSGTRLPQGAVRRL